MRYFEINDGTYIQEYGISDHTGTEITEERYNAIINAVENMPSDTETTSYRLKVDLTYEPTQIEPMEDEIDDAEAFRILVGEEE